MAKAKEGEEEEETEEEQMEEEEAAKHEKQRKITKPKNLVFCRKAPHTALMKAEK